MDASFPRLSPSGLHVVSGFGTVYVDGRAVAAGQHGCWLNDDEIAYCDPNGVPHALNVHTGSGGPLAGPTDGVNSLAAGGNTWIGWRAPDSVRLGDGRRFPGFSPAVNDDGLGCYLTAPTSERHELRLTNGQTIAAGLFENPRISRLAVAWSAFTGGVARRTFARLLFASTPVDVHASYQPYEFCPIPVDVNWDVWIFSNDDSRLLLRPAGHTIGYVVHDGPIHDSAGKDARWVPSLGQIRIVWGNTNGSLGEAWIALDDPRVPLNVPPPEPPVFEPVPMAPGTVVNALDYVIPAAWSMPRHNEKNEQVDWHVYDTAKHRYAEVKFGSIDEDGISKFFVAFCVLDGWIRMVQDWSRGDVPVRPYYFSDDRWIAARVEIGVSFEAFPIDIIECDEFGWNETRKAYGGFRQTVTQGWHQIDIGGDYGVVSVIETQYDPSFYRPPGDHDLIERTWHASDPTKPEGERGIGRVRYIEIRKKTGEVVKDTWSVWKDSEPRAVPVNPTRPWPTSSPEPEPEPEPHHMDIGWIPTEDLLRVFPDDPDQTPRFFDIQDSWEKRFFGNPGLVPGGVTAWYASERGWYPASVDCINRFYGGRLPGDLENRKKIAQYASHVALTNLANNFPHVPIPREEIPPDPFR